MVKSPFLLGASVCLTLASGCTASPSIPPVTEQVVSSACLDANVHPTPAGQVDPNVKQAGRCTGH
ncbi:MAG TPA: hypothetical protein VGV14_06360 [Rhodanobacter sp.]|nr:hypothetical protein [Rhodanobacter sp.]